MHSHPDVLEAPKKAEKESSCRECFTLRIITMPLCLSIPVALPALFLRVILFFTRSYRIRLTIES